MCAVACVAIGPASARNDMLAVLHLYMYLVESLCLLYAMADSSCIGESVQGGVILSFSENVREGGRVVFSGALSLIGSISSRDRPVYENDICRCAT